MSGFGVLRIPDKKFKYEGEFLNGKLHGFGELTVDHKQFTGTFKDDMKNGLFLLKYKQSKTSFFLGTYKDDKFEGEGKYIYS